MNNFKNLFEEYAAIVFFDTETTGLDADTDRIIELAAVRIEQTELGELRIVSSADLFIKLPDGQKIPEKVSKLTGITDETLEAEGVTEARAAAIFGEMIGKTYKGRSLLVAHNAQFDLLFIQAMAERLSPVLKVELKRADYLDTLTVYKDRRAYPHKLANAIVAYKLEDKVKNSHRAIDDVLALFEVCRAMENERDNLLAYVNLFGYNPKYGVSGRRLPGVTYWPQHFNNYMQAPSDTLPARCKRKTNTEGGTTTC